MKVAVVTNMLSPYRVPVFAHLGAYPGVELNVLVCVDREADRYWRVRTDGIHYTVHRLRGPTLNLRNTSGEISRIIHLKIGILGWLCRHRPDVAILGDASWTSYLAALACRCFAIPYVWWNGIGTLTAISGGGTQRVRRHCVLGARAWLAYGTSAKQFLRSLGVPAERIRRALNSADTALYTKLRRQSQSRREPLRRRCGVHPGDFALLYVGKLIRRKRVVELLQAAAAVDAELRPIHLWIAGTGPLDAPLQSEAKRLGYTGRVRILGHLEPEQLAPYYAAADGLALPSDDEPWGLVVNEALLFGKPVLASDRVGAAADLIDERTGVVIDDVSMEGIRRGLVDFTGRSFSEEDCLRRAAKATPEKMAAEFVLAAKEAINRHAETKRRNRAA